MKSELTYEEVTKPDPVWLEYVRRYINHNKEHLCSFEHFKNCIYKDPYEDLEDE